MELSEKTLNSHQIFDGRVVKVFKDEVELADGRKSFREVVKHTGGVVILAIKAPSPLKGKGEVVPKPCDRATCVAPLKGEGEVLIKSKNTPTPTLPLGEGKVLMVKQFRYPMKEVLLELPAGKLEKGEDPFEAAKRELKEETGYCANKWTELGFVYTSPGYSDEKLHLYLAEELEFIRCHPDDGEILQPLELKINEALKMIDSGKINDAKTLCAFMRVFPLIRLSAPSPTNGEKVKGDQND